MNEESQRRPSAPVGTVRGAVACGVLALWMSALLFGWALGGLAHVLLVVALVATPWRELATRLAPSSDS